MTDDQRTTRAEFLELDLSAGDVAIRKSPPEWVLVMRAPDTPAGEYRVDPGGTLDEWTDCDPDADVVVGVILNELEDALGTFGSEEDVRQGVADGRVFERVFAAGELIPAPAAIVERADTEDGLPDPETALNGRET